MVQMCAGGRLVVMDPEPPPQFVAYPRGEVTTFGSYEKFKALGEGYFGLNWVFLANVLMALGLRPLLASQTDVVPFVVVLPLFGLVIACLSYPFNNKIAYGCNWAPGLSILASVLMGINSALCCGLVGYVVMQMIALQEMKKYGIKSGFLGFKKTTWKAKLQLMAEAEKPAP